MKSVAIFYKDIPFHLNDFMQCDPLSTLTKEGLHDYDGLRCNRAIIALEPINMSDDKTRFDKLVRLLDILETNQEILGYSVKS